MHQLRSKISAQLLALVHLLSRCYAPAASSPKHNCMLSLVQYMYARSGGHSWLSFINVIIQAHPARASSCTKILSTNRMWPAAIPLNYSVKNIQNDVQQKIIIWKIAREHTSVGLAHARPNYHNLYVLTLIQYHIDRLKSNIYRMKASSWCSSCCWLHYSSKYYL